MFSFCPKSLPNLCQNNANQKKLSDSNEKWRATAKNTARRFFVSDDNFFFGAEYNIENQVTLEPKPNEFQLNKHSDKSNLKLSR